MRTWSRGNQGPSGTSSPVALLPCRDRGNDQSLAKEGAVKCGSRQAENLCESIAVTGKSESVLRAAFVACLSLVFAARWEKPVESESPFAVASPLGKHSIRCEIRIGCVGCCSRMPELVSAEWWKIPAWSEILFALAPLCLREACLHI